MEPSPYTASSHPLLEWTASAASPSSSDAVVGCAGLQHLTSRGELVYQDALCINPEAQQQQAANEEQQPGGGSQILAYLSHWDFCNPSRMGKRRAGGSSSSSSSRRREGRERSSARDPRSRFTSRIPHHKKADLVDDLSWHLDHTHIMDHSHHQHHQMGHHHQQHHHHHHQHPGDRSSERMPGSVGPGSSGGGNAGGAGSVGGAGTGGGGGGGNGPPSMGPPGSVKNEREASALGTSLNSPASLGTPVSVMTPKGPAAPGSVRTPGDPASLSLMSPHQPPSNGPLTPMDTSGGSGGQAVGGAGAGGSVDQKPPRTPKSVPPPSYSVASPYTSVKSVERKPPDGIGGTAATKQEDAPEQNEEADSKQQQQQQSQQQQPQEVQLPANSLFAAARKGHRGQADPSITVSTTTTSSILLPSKRPALPSKEYEVELRREDFLSDSVYDYRSMRHWLNHPVKRFRPSERKASAAGGGGGGGGDDPPRPMYRRNSQAVAYANAGNPSSLQNLSDKPGDEAGVKREEASNPASNHNDDASARVKAEASEPNKADVTSDPFDKKQGGGGKAEKPMSNGGGGGFDDPYEFSDGINGKEKQQRPSPADEGSYFTSKGLNPSMSDLDNLFDDSSDEQDGGGGAGGGDAAPTPPDSNKPAGAHGEDEEGGGAGGKGSALKSSAAMNGKKQQDAAAAAASLAHDQLSQMFPTPPSNDMTSPENMVAEVDGGASVGGGGPVCVKGEASASMMSVLADQGGLLEGLEDMDWSTSVCPEKSMAVMLASSLFAPLQDLYSSRLGPLPTTDIHFYKERTKAQLRELRQRRQQQQHQHHQSSSGGGGGGSSGPNSVPTPMGTPGNKPGVSPIASPRSHHGPGSNYHAGGETASPAPASSFNKSSASSQQANKNNASASSSAGDGGGADLSKAPEANSLLLNLMLSDTLMNVFRDHNFDSCTLCVCSNEGNVRGRDASVYLPPSELGDSSGSSSSKTGGGGGGGSDGGGDDISCSCGFSAVVNRRLAHQSGLFYEDETEVTSITEDLYFRKKASLLLLDPKGHDHHHGNVGEGGDTDFAEKSAEVDSIPPPLLELILRQSSFSASGQNALFKYSRQYLRTVVQPTPISMVELVDGNDVIFSALDQVRKVTVPVAPSAKEGQQQQQQGSKLDEAQKGTCLHKWALLPCPGPLCSEDVIRVMKSLQPLLNNSLHSPGGISTSLRKQPPTPVSSQDKSSPAGAGKGAGADGGGASKQGGSKASASASAPSSNLSVQGPLTWRQFHRMAGPATKGNTDDQCEPLPVPAVTVGHERDFLTLSPLSLHFWESLGLEPFSARRDVVYIVVAPDNEFLLGRARRFFKNLSNIYELCRLGRHVPYEKMVRDGILKVGKLAANKISNSETQRWFDLIGDFPTAALLKLYSQVCLVFILAEHR